MHGSHPQVLRALALAVGLASSACAARVYPPTVGGYATVYADSVPPDITTYPHVAYEGGNAYLVDGRWYYPSGGGWVVLREEPPVLYGYRSRYVQHAPPAYEYRRYPGRYAPPAQYGYPPPAVRER
jgi:hypothetical protein